MELNKYNTIILDFDGVILNSNNFKKQSIYKAVFFYTNKNTAEKFTFFFISNNGIPREKKIFNYFKNDKLSNLILNLYNKILNENLKKETSLTQGFSSFINKKKIQKHKKYIISGGTCSEVISILKHHSVYTFFDDVRGGPLSKYENINLLKLTKPCLYIGDSKLDYEVAIYYKFDFIFMYEHTQFNEWKAFFKNKHIQFIKNLNELL